MKIAVRRGHQYTGQDGSAQGIVKEIDVAERYYKLVIEGLKTLGHEVLDVTPPEANRTLSDSLNYGINKANDWGAELFVSCHANKAYNNYDGKLGCEVIYHKNSSNGKEIAINIEKELSNLKFKSRGAKEDIRGLAEINNTKMPSVIIEPFFVEATGDVATYNSVGDKGIANAIVKGITGHDISTESPSLNTEDPKENVYVITKYLPEGYMGKANTDFKGIDTEYIREHMCGVRWELRANSLGQWIVTELLDPQTAIKVKESLGNWFFEFRTSNK